MYHNVPADPGRYAGLGTSITSYFVEKQRFASQLAEISANGGWFLKIDRLPSFFGVPRFRGPEHAESLDSALYPDRESMPYEPELSWQGFPVLLSFDDGWQDSVEVAGPILESQGCWAYLFVTTQFVGRPYFVDRRQLQNLPKSQFQLGSHAQSHRLLSLLTEPEIRTELQDSRAFLEDISGSAVESLSVPGGAVDDRVRRIAREVGYRFLFTSDVHANSRQTSPLAIGRLAIKRNTSSADLKRYVRQQFLREQLRRSLLGTSKRLLGLDRYEKLRQSILGHSQLYP
jgi:peptidoglycan/xylan/chitin deacetylase (PgdA/CDA1 family)